MKVCKWAPLQFHGFRHQAARCSKNWSGGTSLITVPQPVCLFIQQITSRLPLTVLVKRCSPRGRRRLWTPWGRSFDKLIRERRKAWHFKRGRGTVLGSEKRQWDPVRFQVGHHRVFLLVMRQLASANSYFSNCTTVLLSCVTHCVMTTWRDRLTCLQHERGGDTEVSRTRFESQILSEGC